LDHLPVRLLRWLGRILLRVPRPSFVPVQRLAKIWPRWRRSDAPTPSVRPVPAVPPVRTPEHDDAAGETTIPIHRPGPSSGREGVFAELNESALGDKRYADYELPGLNLLEDSPPGAPQEHDQVLRERAALLEKTFNDFGLRVRVVGINTGPVITQY